MQTQGILIGTDEDLEWLLPWWWARYSTHNNYPVTFVDFGMSRFGRNFCEERGTVITLDMKAPSLPLNQREWEALFGKALWKNRKGWMKKPFAMLLSPFEKTLWLDIDCEVLGSLIPLFQKEGSIFLTQETMQAHQRERERQTIRPDETLYNSGVILYMKTCPLIEKWTKSTLEKKEQFWSDQHILSRIIHEEKIVIDHLHENYNWRMSQGFNLNAVIVHWAGSWGKEYIRLHGGIADALASIPIR